MYQRTLNNYAVELASSEADKPAIVHIKARSKNNVLICMQEYEDFDGMVVPDVISLNVEHDVDRTIGKAYNFKLTEYGLECDAEIYPSLPADNADGQRMINMLKLGIPLQASITFDVDDLGDIEELKDGELAEVNGLSVTGPAVIYRRWNLRSLAICIHGADNATGVEPVSLNKHLLEVLQMKKQRADEACENPEEKKPEEQLEDTATQTPETATEEPDRIAAVEAAIDELKAAVAEIQAKLASETDAVQIEESDEEPEKEDEEKKELSAKIDTLEKTVKTLSDNLVKTLSTTFAERQPVGYVGNDEEPSNGSIRFSALGVPCNVKK